MRQLPANTPTGNAPHLKSSGYGIKRCRRCTKGNSAIANGNCPSPEKQRLRDEALQAMYQLQRPTSEYWLPA